MANHLTPDELSKELGMERQDVIRLSVPVEADSATGATWGECKG